MATDMIIIPPVPWSQMPSVVQYSELSMRGRDWEGMFHRGGGWVPICYINPDGSHVAGCEPHVGAHPLDWCRDRRAERHRRVLEIEAELADRRRDIADLTRELDELRTGE